MQFQASSAGAENRASQSCSRRHGNATIHLSAKQKSDPYQEYPEVLVGTKYIYDLGSLFIVTFHLKQTFLAQAEKRNFRPLQYTMNTTQQAPDYSNIDWFLLQICQYCRNVTRLQIRHTFLLLNCLFLHLILCLTTCKNRLIETILTNGQTQDLVRKLNEQSQSKFISGALQERASVVPWALVSVAWPPLCPTGSGQTPHIDWFLTPAGSRE